MRKSPYPMVGVQQALAVILHHVTPLPTHALALQDALGLVLASDVRASQSLPAFAAAVVDGFALQVADGHRPRRLAGEQMAGQISGLAVSPGTAIRITTGAPVPDGADAVVKVEQADEVDGTVTPHESLELRVGQGIRSIGSDMRNGALALVAGTVLGPAEIGLLASLGRSSVPIHRLPVVGVLSSGDELVEVGQPVGPGQIHDSNRPALMAAITQAGGQPVDLGIVRDRPGELEARVADGLARTDALVTSGGVSMGELDLLKPLLARWGTVHFGRVRMKPGKPLTFATLPVRGAGREQEAGHLSRPVFALPGNPVSSLVTFQLFVRPAIRRLLGHRNVTLPRLQATLEHSFTLDPERPEFHRVTLKQEGDRLVAASTGGQASSRLLSMAGANGLLILEEGQSVLPAGSVRPVLLLDSAWPGPTDTVYTV